jgi:hypothetical protein
MTIADVIAARTGHDGTVASSDGLRAGRPRRVHRGIQAVPVDNVDLDGQWITVDRTASESGGKRDIRTDLKTRAAERVVAIPDIAMPAVRRLVDSGAKGREISTGKLSTRLVNGERGGYLGYAIATCSPRTARPSSRR